MQIDFGVDIKKGVETLQILFKTEAMLEIALIKYEENVFPECEIHEKLRNIIQETDETIKNVACHISHTKFDD